MTSRSVYDDQKSHEIQLEKESDSLLGPQPPSHKMGIVNLSSFPLNREHIKVLEKGLSFCPSNSLDLFEVTKDLHLFARKLALKKIMTPKIQIDLACRKERDTLDCLETLLYEQSNEITDILPKTDLKKKSTYMPSFSSIPNISVFVQNVSQELTQVQTTKIVNDNLTKSERRALKELINHQELVIKPADKGGNVVIHSQEYYIKEAMRQLLDETQYAKSSFEEFHKSHNELLFLLNEARRNNLITSQEFVFLYNHKPKTPVFYWIPKLHKSIKNPPGRPIISGMGGPTEGISNYIDRFLQPFVNDLRTFVQDSTDVIKKLDGINVTDKTILVSLDVESLYSSIPHSIGIATCEKFLNTRGVGYGKHSKFVSELLKFVLENNIFVFDGKYYKQKQGTAMGGYMCPNLCLFTSW
ncbi:uncharacterized protein LOC128665863 [Bombina bombina]|uniref:uncharacterized protein LOC128665863 n=1 Tax=Bombina bombina TaxID=8345 RepID=UPI00235B1C80|nr:uncharacterized protein LOC128665863 [Bombina bombina]